MQSFAHAPNNHRRSIDVLLVEDDDTDARIINMVADLVEGFSLGLTRVHNVDDAKTALRTGKFDVCLVDFWLGRESSLRFLAALDEMDAVLGTVVLSNISSEDAIKLRLADGRSRFLPKMDCTPQRLQDAIGAVIAPQF